MRQLLDATTAPHTGLKGEQQPKDAHKSWKRSVEQQHARLAKVAAAMPRGAGSRAMRRSDQDCGHPAAGGGRGRGGGGRGGGGWGALLRSYNDCGHPAAPPPPPPALSCGPCSRPSNNNYDDVDDGGTKHT
jgi:hypothetical protein